MTLASAADTVFRDLSTLQSRMVASGWPVRARILGAGVSGHSRRGGSGIFLRMNADGEEYIFTLTGNPVGIEQMVMRGHDLATAALAREDLWERYGGATRLLDDTESQDSEVSAGYDVQEMDPTPRRRQQRALLDQHTFGIQRRPDGLWTACVTIPTSGGPLYLCATADEHAVAQALQTELGQFTGGRSFAASGDFRAVAGAVASERATDRLGASLRQMVRDPGVQSVFSSIVPMIPFVGVPAAAAFQGARAALDVVDKVNKGDPAAVRGLQTAVAKAKRGDKKALVALKAIRLAQKIKKGEVAMPKEPDPRMAALESENKLLQMKLEATEDKWEGDTLDAADDFTDLWGANDDYVGVDIVSAAGDLVGRLVEGISPRLAKPVVSRYFRDRLPQGSQRGDYSACPEVGALYHRPMRESADASVRKDYLRGSALQTAGFPAGRRFLDFRRGAVAAGNVPGTIERWSSAMSGGNGSGIMPRLGTRTDRPSGSPRRGWL